MSIQSIRHKTGCDLNNKADDVLICMAERLILNKKYMLGKEPSMKDFLNIKMLKRILCENNCRLICNREKIKEALNTLIIKYNK